MKYEIKNITPKEMMCIGVAFCPAIYENESKYLIIGKIADAKKFGLEKKVGADECLIEVDKRLIDKKQE